MIALYILFILATAPLLFCFLRILFVRSPVTQHSPTPLMSVICGAAVLSLTVFLVIGTLGGGFAEAQYHAATLGWSFSW